ncbi:MAG: sucrase ferredoxin [Actinomycetota bacterium]
MTAEIFRCTAAAEARGEPLFGTASFVRRWLLLEQPGSWGRDALSDSKLPKPFAQELHRRTRALGIRVILIRRGVRTSAPRRQCYFVRTSVDDSYQAHLWLDDVTDLLDVDLSPLAQGGAIAQAEAQSDPLFLVCTHGRHDACCSIRGNQVSRVACAQVDRDAWECSHIGGDRFAANVVCFPHGLYYGRVGAGDVTRLMDAYSEGLLELGHYRGRCAYPFSVQAAEYFVRRERGITRVDDVTLLSFTRREDGVRATFALPGGERLEAAVAVAKGAAHRLTCTATGANPIPSYSLVSISAPG